MTRTASSEEVVSAAVPRDALVWVVVLVFEAIALVGYFSATSATMTQIRYVVYPFVWINAGLWAILRTTPTPQNRRHRLLGVLVAVGYFLVVMGVPGNVGLGGLVTGTDLRIAWYAPGWGPLLAFDSSWIRLYLVPFEVVGYASLAYLVYANVLAVARGTIASVLGIATCVGCTVPILAPAVGLLGGPATALTTTAYQWSYDVGTVLFLVTLGLLHVSHRRSRP
ncbi:hypothetical protein [Haloferax sp. YSMS24]|uniref:DUF7546 family protein n=1 Tax=Haloferax sp. YSMS24 TaxID=3388425 RepID=UPI00398D26CF